MKTPVWIFVKIAPALAVILLVGSYKSSLFGTADYQRAAGRLLSGQDFYGYINYDERSFQAIMARDGPADVTVLVAGSSRTMQLDADCFDGKYYNASVSGAMISDLAAIVEQFRRGRTLKHVVFAADPWMLNAHEQYEAWDGVRIAPNLDRVHAAPDWIRAQVRLGLTPNWREFTVAARAVLDPYREILAPASYQAAWKARIEGPPLKDANPDNLFRKQPDGSLRYPGFIVNAPAEHVAAAARNAADSHLEATYVGFNRIDPFLARAFEAVTADVVARGARVTLVLAPFHLVYYQRVIHHENGKLLPAVEAYFRNLAHQRGYKVIGSYDPAAVGAAASDFFDGVHLKKGALKRLYGCP